MNKNFKDLTGKIYGHLIVINLHHIKRRAYWLCRCNCGNITICISSILNSGNTKSCGCQKLSGIERNRFKHGMVGTRVYHAWSSMIQRCANPNNISYKNYGARGITVIQPWLDSFMNFFNDMGYPPTTKHEIERINNDLGYSSDNCKWATRQEQSLNRRTNKFINYQGDRIVYSEWAKRMNMNIHTLYGRLRAGWSYDRIISEPVRHFHRL